MNELDQFVKHELKARYYGRYVDDMVLMHEDAAVLNQWRQQIDAYLWDRLRLRVHPNKIWLNNVAAGIDFIGFYIKPGRTYIRQSTLNRGKQKVKSWQRKGAPMDTDSLTEISQSVTSYLALLRHVNGYRARCSLSRSVHNLFLQSRADDTKITPV